MTNFFTLVEFVSSVKIKIQSQFHDIFANMMDIDAHGRSGPHLLQDHKECHLWLPFRPLECEKY